MTRRAGRANPIKIGKTKPVKKKTAPRVSADKKKATNVRLPTTMKKDMLMEVVKEFSSMRKKSAWVEAALKNFLAYPSWHDQVLDGEMVKANNDVDTFLLEEDTRNNIDNAVDEVYTYVTRMNEAGIRTDNIENIGISRGSIIRSAIAFQLFPSLRTRLGTPPAED